MGEWNLLWVLTTCQGKLDDEDNIKLQLIVVLKKMVTFRLLFRGNAASELKHTASNIDCQKNILHNKPPNMLCNYPFITHRRQWSHLFVLHRSLLSAEQNILDVVPNLWNSITLLRWQHMWQNQQIALAYGILWTQVSAVYKVSIRLPKTCARLLSFTYRSPHFTSMSSLCRLCTWTGLIQI